MPIPAPMASFSLKGIKKHRDDELVMLTWSLKLDTYLDLLEVFGDVGENAFNTNHV